MNNYKFNWDAVLAHCPEYRKYLVDVKSLRDDAEEDLIIPEVDDLGLFGQRTDEELEVIRQMSDGANNSLGWRHRQALGEITMPKDDTIHYTLSPVYENQPLPAKMNPLQLPPPKCVLDIGSEIYFPSSTGWHMNYRIVGNSYKDDSVDLIKTKVNDKGDKIQLVKAIYWFDQKKNVIGDRSGRFKCLTYNKKTRNLYYIFRGLKNPLARGASKRYKSNIRGILLDRMTLTSAISDTPMILLKSFVDILEKAVLKDVPEAYVPIRQPPKPRKHWNSVGYRVVVDTHALDERDFLQTKLLTLLLQHKANARLDWLNTNVLSNVSKLISIQGFEEQVTDINMRRERGQEYTDYLKSIHNEHKRRVGKVIPTLRASKSLKALTRAVCGKFYAKILVKLMNTVEVDSQTWISIIKTLHYGRMPKFLYHWLSNLLNNGIKGNEVLESVILEILKTHGDLNVTIKDERERNITILELWVKTSKKFLEQGGFINTWFTWRDMYRMADRMNIRLRPNKFKNEEDVKHQHNLLSELTNRDRSMLRDYADVTFKELTIPDEEYDGFTFVQLITANDLVHEGKTMHHCVGGYASRCVEGQSIIFSMRKGDRGYVTVELDGMSLPYHVHQKYSIDDVYVTNEATLELINNWIEDVNELHKEDMIPYAQECKNVANTFKAERRLEKLMELKDEANEDTLTHINNECAKLEQQLATLAIETTQVAPPPEATPALSREDIEDVIDLMIDPPQWRRDVVEVLNG